ncbi:MAG: NifB/NifX family molybdenum-iron cluster-binding protein [Magnetospirillum sp.]
MKIAIASQNWLTITNHPGKTGRFRVFEVQDQEDVRELDRLELPTEMFIHNFKDSGDHPLYHMDVLIAGTAGSGFIDRLARYGVTVATTSEKDPLAAISHYRAGTLPPSEPHHH